MKLIRLSTTNNGHFKSAFGNDMTIAPKSKMALLNLTFQSDIGAIPGMQIVGGSSMSLENSLSNTRTIPLAPDDFDDGDFTRFKQTIEYHLNSLPQTSYGRETLNTQANTSGSGWRIIEDTNGKLVLEFSYAPLTNPLHILAPDGSGYNTIMSHDPSITQVAFGGADNRFATISKDEAEPATLGRANNLLADVPMAQGSAWFSARVHNLTDNGVAGENNGFGIGVSKVPLSSVGINPGDEIPSEHRHYEIRVNRPGEPYVIIKDSGLESTTVHNPENTSFLATSNNNLHDVITIELDNGKLEQVLYQNQNGGSVGARYVLATTTVNPGEKFYPYIYIRGAKLHCDIDLVNYVADPFYEFADRSILENRDYDGWANGQDALMANGAANIGRHLPNVKSAPDGTSQRWDNDDSITVGIPQNILNALGFSNFSDTDSSLFIFASRLINASTAFGWEERADVLPKVYSSDNFLVESMSVPLDSFDASQVEYNGSNIFNPNMSKNGRRKNILNALGFSNFSDTDSSLFRFASRLINASTAFGWEERADVLPKVYSSDNFLVESMSVPLDSFDASQVEYNGNNLFNANMSKNGRRKNILMTIPENDNTTGLLEFETSTPIFIDINNTEPINVKNLDFRILRKDFTPIIQSGEPAIMTVLIDN